jgi:hypothetical protein
VVVVVAGVVTALLLSAALLQGATNPWPGLFAATRGAQIWLRLAPGSDVRTMGTSAHPYPFRVVQGRLYHAPEQAVAAQGLLDLRRAPPWPPMRPARWRPAPVR